MTPEKQRIAIARACDWCERNPYPGVTVWEGPMGETREDGDPPDFLNDLNAMHAVEAGLLGHQMIRYQAILSEICPKNPHVSCWDILHATAAQRAEAFLKTVGKWEE